MAHRIHLKVEISRDRIGYSRQCKSVDARALLVNGENRHFCVHPARHNAAPEEFECGTARYTIAE